MTDEEFEHMSDEEFAEYENSAEAVVSDEDLATLDTETSDEGSNDPEQEEDVVTIDEPEMVEETEDLEDTDPVEEVEEEGEPEEDIPEVPETETETEEENTPESAEAATDYKTYYESVMAPIKANGQEIQIKSPEDARTLIQKGLNYDAKMVGIKPVRLAGKALERAGVIRDGIIDEDALNRMIDFNNGDIEVVKARLKELEIDPLDLDLDATNYQAQDHMVSEHSVEIDDVQRELDTRGSTEQVVNVLNGMDVGSKNFFAENPQNLLGLEQDITSGVFDEIYGNVRYEKSMGRLNGMTDMEAYVQFAKARGDSMRVQETEAPAVKTPTKTVNAKKRAKAAGSGSAPAKTVDAINPFDLSDEEFEKQFGGAQALR